jgi:HAD superfamily 5'-nucleotidase-like hydrolase
LANEFDLPTPIRKLLFESGLEVDAPFDRRIYTNRDLNLDKIGLIGFDMDYTLAIYRQDAIEELSLQTTIAKLLARGYPEQLQQAESDPRFAIRGLMVDKKFGNIIKMDRHGYVGRAYHGKGKLSSEERKAIYRNQRLGMEHERFAPVDTLFALPEVTLYAEVVELLDNQPQLWGDDTPTYAETWRDVRECIDEAHRDGSIKDIIKKSPQTYIDRDPDLPRTLHKLRSAGKRLFLLTNSFFPYTDVAMRYLLSGALPSYESWTAYFDWTVVGSSKPGFFADGQPFQELDRDGTPIGPRRQDVQRGKLYEGGNQFGLQRSFDCHGDEVLYVGDHIYGDIVKSKKSSGWRTALIVQELQHEVRVRRARDMTLGEIESLYTLRSQLAEAITAHRYQSRVVGRLTAEELATMGIPLPGAQEMLEETRLRIRRRLDRLRNYEKETLDTLQRRVQEVDGAFNPYWGSSFAERHDASRFGAQVENYACIYTSRVSNFQFVSPAKYFISPHGSLPHW